MFMEMSTLFLKKIKKFLSLFLWLFALGNDRINEVVFQKEKSGMEGIALDKTAECKLVLDTAVPAGKIMLQSGAEIHRVEDTIHRILKVSGMKTAEAFVMPTGLIVTLDDPRMDSMTVVKRIKTRGTNLSRIAEVNDISRRFCSGNISLEEAFHSLKHMKQYTYTALQKYIAQIMVAFFFAILLGGNGWDAVGAGAAGIGMVLILYLGRKIGLNDFFQLLLASAVIAVVAYLAAENPYQTIQMDIVIIAAIMPIVPGAAITTAVRDTMQGDYVAGGAKALEAFVSAAAIAAGVSFGMILTGVM